MPRHAFLSVAAILGLSTCVSLVQIPVPSPANARPCHSLYRSIEHDYLAVRGVQLAAGQMAFGALVFLGPVASAVFLAIIPGIEGIKYHDSHKADLVRWKELGCGPP